MGDIVYKNKLTAFGLLTTLSLLISCQDLEKNNKSNRIKNGKNVNEIIENEGIKLQVISETELKRETLGQSLLLASDPKAIKVLNSLPLHRPAPSQNKDLSELKNNAESLLIGFPIGLVGEENIFGGVITKVTDQDNESLGNLKLTDLPPIHVKTMVSFVDKLKPVLTLVGCFSQCSEESELMALINFPIKGLDLDTGMLIVDLASVGKELDLISILDPFGDYTKLKPVFSNTVFVDFDTRTLIFDVETKMIPLTADPNNTTIKTTDFTVRWYLRLGSGFGSSFKAREPISGVGFFQTERSSQTKITRFSTTTNPTKESPVHYYIKNVPKEFRPSFVIALESWNKEFKKIIGKSLISYEFIETEDPESKLLVPGDIRYNIIEWDLVNKAGYGGLGPSIANQFTGQTICANVLIQGPTIVKLYKEWFGVSEKARELIAQGRVLEANKIIKNFEVSVTQEMSRRNQRTFKVKLGQYLEMNIPSQRMEFEDPIKKGHFELVPAGVTYEKYMEGYMTEIVAHEIGHNLGLRHNFKGNLGAIDTSSEPGTVSRSVMEYLGRPFRHLNIIGAYDKMAIAYGYKGEIPKHLNWYCTDEDQGTDAKTLAIKSPECSKSDATSDPFSFWENRIDRVLDLILERKSPSEPVWNVTDVKTQINEAIIGISAYALSAESTAGTWTNFFGKNDRPDDKSMIKNYVLERLKKKICDPNLDEIILQKETPQGQKTAENNLIEFKKDIVKETSSLGLYNAEDIGCL